MPDVTLFYPSTGEPTHSVSFPYSSPEHPIEVLTNRNVGRTASGVPFFQAHGRPAYRLTYKLELISDHTVAQIHAFLEAINFAGSEVRRNYFSVADQVFRDVFCRVVYPTSGTKQMTNVHDLTLVFEQLTHPDHVTDADSEAEPTQGGGEIGEGEDDAPNITSPLVATGKVGEAFSYTITAVGAATITFDADDMPAWMSRVGDVLSGTPTEGDEGETAVTLTATNGDGADTATLLVRIEPADAEVEEEEFAAVYGDLGYRFYLSEAVIDDPVYIAGTRPLTFGSVTGALPAGLTFNTTSVRFTGTLESGAEGEYDYERTVENDAGSDTMIMYINVGVPPSVSGGGEFINYPGDSVSETITGTGILHATISTFGSLPPNLDFDPETLTISGTLDETDVGEYTFSVTFTTPLGSDVAEFVFKTYPEEPIITSSNAGDAAEGFPVDFQVTATGRPTITFSLDGEPVWLSINSSTGELSGTPPFDAVTIPPSNNFDFDIIATSAEGEDVQPFVLTVQNTEE